jgi:predicted O-linked N-acetylglucosamine transferase (SPINDLY family)
VQAHWVGYPGTLAAPFVDYLFVDRIVAPEAHASSYAEALVTLPHCYQPNDRSRVASTPPPRAELGLAGDAVVLASLVAPWKLNAAVFDAWARILVAVPDALLWLLSRDAADPVIERARRAFATRGVLPERIVFATRRAPADYLALYAHADLALDTWPYGAHTTAADALWMGCPLVTWLGESFASRVAASVVTTAGVPELAAGDVDGYVALATDLARDAPRRASLRERLTRARKASPLYDAATMARAVESACETMTAQAAAGVRRGFDVAA